MVPCVPVGVYLGHLPQHAGNVALILNLQTLNISPQFHVIFDDTFSTVESITKSVKPPNWSDLCNLSSNYYTDKEYDLTKLWFKFANILTDPEDVKPTTANPSPNPLLRILQTFPWLQHHAKTSTLF